MDFLEIFNYENTVTWMEGFGVPGFLLWPTIILEIILPVIPKECRSMIYKIAIVYKNTKFQQRWISKLIELSPFTEEEIANYYRTQLDDEQFAEVFPNLVTHDR